MANSDCSENKTSQTVLTRQMKPFIDHNLQFQLPTAELSFHQTYRSHCPIYSHYMGTNPTISSLMPQVNEEELFQAMRNAEQAYQAWKNLKEQIKQRMSN